MDRIASQARQVIRESRRLLETSSRSGLGSVASDALSSRPAPDASEDLRELRRRQNLEAEQAALELEKGFDEAVRKQKLATRQAEALLSECQAELESRKAAGAESGGPGTAAREEAATLRLAARKAEESARQQASEQREVRQRLQQLIDTAKAEVASVAQHRAEVNKQKQASTRRQQKQLQKVKATCVELSQKVQEKKCLCEETSRQISSTGLSIASCRRTATEVGALATALHSRVDGDEETETLETLESGEGSLCDTGGSDTGARRELAENALSAKLTAARDRCRSLEQQALLSAAKAEELSALVEHYQLQLAQPDLLEGDGGSKELRTANAEQAELKKAHRQALAELDGRHLQKLVTSLTDPSRGAKSESAPSPTSVGGPSEAAQKVVHCEAEHIHELALVEQRIAGHELSQYQALISRPVEASCSPGTLQDLQGRTKLRAAKLAARSLQQLGGRVDDFLLAGRAKDLDLTGKIAPVVVDSLKSVIHESIDSAKMELQSWRSQLTSMNSHEARDLEAELQESICQTSQAREDCRSLTEFCMTLRASVAALESDAAVCAQQREQELHRGAALRARLEEALRAEAAMGAELCAKLEEECREVKVSAQGLALSSNHEEHACAQLREELRAEEDAADQLAARVAGLERTDAEVEERRQQLLSRMAAVSKALDFKAAGAQQLQEEARACCEARAQAVVATEAEHATLRAALANLEAEKQASLSQEWLLAAERGQDIE